MQEPNFPSGDNTTNKQFELCDLIIDESAVSPETKEAIKQALNHLQKESMTAWENFDEAVYGTISTILTFTERDQNKDEAKELFKNIRKEIWEFYTETNNKSI